MIYLGSDHAGFALKQEVKKILDGLGAGWRDLGNEKLDPSDDYPDYAFAVGEAVAKEQGAFGILACGSAQGICVAANKVKGIRAVVVLTAEEAAKAREHNDANVLCLSGWHQDGPQANDVIAAFLNTAYPATERHARRLQKITAYESH